MPFYTLIVNHDPAVTSNINTSGVHKNRSLLITPDRETADTLFRIIQDDPSGVSPKAPFKEVRHLSPQIWSWSAQDSSNNNQNHLSTLILEINNGTAVVANNSDGYPLKRLQGTITLHSLPDWDSQTIPPIIPSIDAADHISGNIFCIRNKRSPDKYWAKPPGKDYHWIRLSTIIRTRFRISAVGKPAGTLMVPEDKVKIWVIRLDDNGREKEAPIGYHLSGRLCEVNDTAQQVEIWFKSFLSGGITLDYKGSANEAKYQAGVGAGFIEEGWQPTDSELWLPTYPAMYKESYTGGEAWELC